MKDGLKECRMEGKTYGRKDYGREDYRRKDL